MQAAICIAPTILPLTPSTSKTQPSPKPKLKVGHLGSSSRSFSVKASTATYEASTVDYSSTISVFPAEACDTIGGEACLAQMYPEVRLEESNNSSRSQRNNNIDAEPYDREYIEYNDAKTVLKGEACDILGGEFCGRQYQRGVY
ncbi:hypothetical protein SLEP1_g35384 [Rubroshorea leprosula]|uniref:Light-regulated protein n=1 Tax=Rubroshorea leprosula TaxID=152421 RepID=A0AAV5KN02_9ROSI|nr:hypothetical protein SLEP1_g35384 [Rubroshorea leprosula]GKV26023.1 hypothetical protein SLEP1_g35384 [Rubroshorea leprosula]